MTTALIGVGCGGRTELVAPSDGEQALASAGTYLDGSGACATVAQMDSVCPPDLVWDNHGQYVSCVTRYLDARVAAGDISEEQKGVLVSGLGNKSAMGTHKDAGFDCQL